jgi:hypothetical protein
MLKLSPSLKLWRDKPAFVGLRRGKSARQAEFDQSNLIGRG